MPSVTLQKVKELIFPFGLWKQLSPHDYYPILAIIPTVVFYFIDPKMFEIDVVGYAVFVYASFFILLTWLLNRLKAKPTNDIHWFGVILSVTLILLFQSLVHAMGLLPSVLNVAEGFGLTEEWQKQIWSVSIDLAAFSIYQTMLTTSFFTLRAVRKFLAPIVYSFLTTIIFLLAAFNQVASSLGFPLFVPYIGVSVASLLPFIGLSAQYSFLQDSLGNFRSILVVPAPRFLAVEINWPCAGIQSVFIYFAVFFSLLQILDISRLRKTIYLTVGFLGTIFVNILRIIALIVLYVYLNADFIIFHQFIGGIFFIMWITLFLSVIFLVEKKKAAHTRLLGDGKVHPSSFGAQLSMYFCLITLAFGAFHELLFKY